MVAAKHVFFSYDSNNKLDTLAAERIKKQLLAQRIRIYQPKNSEDVNISIAKGIEQAACVLTFPSASFQESKNGSKILNYADQRKSPILTIQHLPDFQPTEWLGAILAAMKKSSVDFTELFAVMQHLVNMEELVLNVNENIIIHEKGEIETYWTYSRETVGELIEVKEKDLQEVAVEKEILFHGGSDEGNVLAYYEQYDEKHPMEFQFFGLEAGRIFGQGDDDVGSFTLSGSYTDFEKNDGDFNFTKKYIGKHEVEYDGKISSKAGKCVLKGRWRIQDFGDAFCIELDFKPKSTETSQAMHTHRHFATMVMISYCPSQYELAQKIRNGLIENGVDTICPKFDADIMIETAATQAKVVIPLMSQAYENSSICKQVLSYADKVGIPIVPVKAQDSYNQSGWLGVICAGALWTQMTNDNDFEVRLNDLLGQLNPYTSAVSNEQVHIEDLVDGTNAQGYYVHSNEKHVMNFDMFAMVKGAIAGHGSDSVGEFVIHGQYEPNMNENFDFQFKKHYVGQHDVIYSGSTRHTESLYILKGYWSVGIFRDKFRLEVARNRQNSPRGLHVMLSYQWNNQELVKRVADVLKKRNIPIWFDIDGGMKGNINASMANGVEKAAIVLSFPTEAYSKSVNCQKELTYATQLKKEIIPVLLENQERISDTWLEMIIASLNKVNMQDAAQFDENFSKLVTQIDALLEEKRKQHDEKQEDAVVTRFEGGSVKGMYYQYGTGFDMSFEHFSLRNGRVSGQGSDQVGHFTLAGEYDNDGNVNFNKQYVGKHLVEYSGILSYDKNGGFRMEGKWSISSCGLSDEFYIENTDNL